MIPYGRQHITQADIDAVVDVLQSDFLTQGPKVPVFELAVTDRVRARHAVAVNSGTSALHVACLALGLGPGDILWTSPITFVASANCALYCGAKVDFVDIDPHTYTMCPKALEQKLKQAKKENRLPKIIIPVHLCGQPCNMQAIFDLSQKYGFKIIEDACHALGGEYKSSPVGNCRYSDITVFSFHPVKIITTGEGGMNTTNDADLASHMARLRSHGITRDPDLMTHAPDGTWYYQQIDLGFNYRMTDIQAALGLSQLVEKIGVLIYSPREMDLLWDHFQPDIIQTPFNILDQRILTSGWLDKLSAFGVEIHARSVFLQGLLLMNSDTRPDKFNLWDDLWKKWHGWLKTEKLQISTGHVIRCLTLAKALRERGAVCRFS